MRLTAAILFAAALLAAPAQAEPATKLLELVNAYRQANGLAALQVDARLARAAARQARDMARDGYFDHVSPAGDTLKDRLERVGYLYSFAGENLAGGQETPSEVLRDWQGSPGHDRVLLTAAAREAGIAFLPNPQGTPIARLWVLVVGAPRP
jgi:uncharacterized protein YkwD